MNRLARKIAWRYLFSKKSHSAINAISIVSVCGVAITTLALVCTLSVYNGFTELIGSLYSQIDPQIKNNSVARQKLSIPKKRLSSKSPNGTR